LEIRDATESDLHGIVAIYNEVIANSTAVYTEQPSTLEDRRAWLTGRRQGGFPAIIAADERGVAGFASFGDWRGSWPGYRHTVEHTVHVRADARGGGVGTALMAALFEHGVALGKHVMIGAIDAANDRSISFHARLGFAEVAHFHEVGRKFNRWLDLVLVQRFLDHPGAEPRII
jgi:L-amino acid N-acyltransferase YncA